MAKEIKEKERSIQCNKCNCSFHLKGSDTSMLGIDVVDNWMYPVMIKNLFDSDCNIEDT